jgi:hypothetical protein
MMESDYTRAQHYIALAKQMREVARGERDARRKNELLSLADQYDHLAKKLVTEVKH